MRNGRQSLRFGTGGGWSHWSDIGIDQLGHLRRARAHRRGLVAGVLETVALVADDEAEVDALDVVEGAQQHFVRDDHHFGERRLEEVDRPLVLPQRNPSVPSSSTRLA